jgi:GAF domain-containing protein
VHVAANLRDLVTAAPVATPQEVQVARERRDLNEIVHGVLIIGLCISTALMLTGVGLDLFYQRDLPTAVPDIAEGIRSLLILPLCVQDTPIGVLRLYSSQVRRFSTEELAFASAVADLGAVAIENAKLHETLKERLQALKEDSNGWYRFLTLS